MNIKAVLFDMDGVLTNSEPCHVEAIKQLFERKGVNLSDDDTHGIFGKHDERIIREICEKKKMQCPVDEWGREKRVMVLDILKNAGLKPFPGVLNLISALKKKYRVAMATSSSHTELEVTLNAIGLSKTFEIILGKEDVVNQKPDPEVYQKLMRKLGVAPNECVIIEDSIAGVEAAKRAGAFCVAVLNSFSSDELSKADMIVKSLEDKTLWRKLNVDI